MERLEPFWFPKEQHQVFIEYLKQNHNEVENIENIRAEVDIAHTRLRLLTINPTFLGLALGYTQGTIPLYFTEQEKTTLLNLQNLPNEIRGLLK